MPKYGFIGRSEVITCDETLRPKDSIRVGELNPNEDVFVLSHDGTWVVRTDMPISEVRNIMLLSEYPVKTLIISVLEHLSGTGNNENMSKIIERMVELKTQYPDK